MGDKIKTSHNTGFASGGVKCKLGALCFYLSSVQVDSFVLQDPPEHKAPNRWQQYEQNKPSTSRTSKYLEIPHLP